MVDKSLNYGRDVIADFFGRIAPYDKVLDIGAGGGADLRSALSACPTAKAFAVESFPANVRVLNAGGIEVHGVNVEREVLPFEDASFDVVMSNQTLEHIKEIFWIMHEISRTLRINGHLIIGVPNLASFHNRLLLLMGKQPTSLKNNSAHVRGYTRPDMLNLFKTVFPEGYRLEAFRGGNFYPFPPWLARPLAKLAPSNAWAIFFLLRKMKPYDGQFLEFPIKQALETNFYLGDEAGRFQHIL